MHNDKYYRSKIPLPLVLLFLVNLFLVCALEILLLYRTPLPLTEAELAEADPRWNGCTILQEHKVDHLWCYLVETNDGELHLIPAKANGLAATRGRIYEKQIIPLPDNIQESTYNIKIGIRTSTVTISKAPLPYMENQEPADLYMAISYAATGGTQGTVTIYMVIAAVLEALELALWHILKQQ